MENQLKSTLKGNALFSLGSGLSLILLSDQIMAFLAITSTFPLKLIGFGLLFFVLFLTFVAYKNKLNTGLVYTIIALDIAWVIASILILIFDPFAISFPGKSVIFLIAMIVSVFALLQYKLIRRL
jgi:hypothetical protein